MKKYTLCLGTDIDCTNVSIEWIGTAGLLVPCQDKNCITVSLDPNATGERCVEGFIICLDKNGNPSCANCEPVYFRKCFCTTDDDCPNGVCLPDGTCGGGCTPTEETQGKVYYPDGCKCPPHKPILDTKTKVCAECISGTKHPDNPCLVCNNGVWVTKNCGTGSVCDESLGGECIPDCTLNTDGRIRYNTTTSQCDCIRGFIWNGKTCVPKVGDCPEGQAYNPITKKCETIVCPDNYIYDSSSDDCIPKPCDNSSCTNGLDCTGINCGCSKTTKKCVSCDDDPTALGCGSIDHDPPTGCDNGQKCKTGYGCYNGECVDCNNFSEAERKNIPGCEGTNSICADTHSIDKDGCVKPLTAKLIKLGNCQCEMLGTSVSLISLTKTGTVDSESYKVIFNADIRKAFANNTSGYEAQPYFTNLEINNERPISANVTIQVTPKYLDILAFNNGDFANAYYDGPVINTSVDLGEGAVDKTTVNFAELTIGSNSILRDSNGKAIAGSQLTGYRLKANISNVVFHNNCTYSAKQLYDNYRDLVVSSSKTYATIAKLTSTSKKNPLLTWKRNDVVFRKLYIQPTSGNIYEDTLFGPQRFANNDERGLQELIAPMGELLPLNTYTSEFDCTCDPVKTVSNFIVCDIEFVRNIHFSINTSSTTSIICNNQIEILSGFSVCDINKNLLEYGWDSSTASKYQTIYILKVNGTEVERFIYNNSLGELVREVGSLGVNQKFVGFKYTSTEAITSVSLEMNHSGSCKKESSIPISNDTATISTTCNDASTYNLTISEVTSSPIKNVTFLGDTRIYGGNPIQYNNIQFSNTSVATNKVTVIFDSGCKKEYPVIVNCCGKENLEIIGSPVVNSTEINLIIQTTSKSPLSSIKVNSSTNSITNFTDVNNVYTGVYYPEPNVTQITVAVKTESECEYIETIDIPSPVNATLTLDNTSICSSGDTVLNFNSDTAGIAIVITGPGNTTYSGITDVNGDKTFIVNDAGTYSLTSYDNVISSYGISTVLSIIASPQVSDFNVTGGLFGVDDLVPFTIVGTPGAIVDVSYTNGTGVSQATININTGTVTFFVDPISLGPLNVTLTNITLAGCSATITGISEDITIVGKYGEPDVPELTLWSSSTSDPIIVASSTEGSIEWYSDVNLTTNVYTGNSYQTTGSQTLYVRVEGVKAPSNVITVVASEFTLTFNQLVLNGNPTGGTTASICSGTNGTLSLDVSITGTAGYPLPVYGTSDFIIDWYPLSAAAGVKKNVSNSTTQTYSYSDTVGSTKLTLIDPSSPDIDYKPFSSIYNFNITENTGCDPCYYFTGYAAFLETTKPEGSSPQIDVSVSGGVGTYTYTLKRYGSILDSIINTGLSSVSFNLSNIQYPTDEGIYEIYITDNGTGCTIIESVDLDIVEYNVAFGAYNCANDTIQVTLTGNTNLTNIQVGVFLNEVLVGFLQQGAINYTTANPFTVNLPGGTGINKVSVNAGSTYNGSSSIYAETNIATTDCGSITEYGPVGSVGYSQLITGISYIDCVDAETSITNVGEFSILNTGVSFGTPPVSVECRHGLSTTGLRHSTEAVTDIILSRITISGVQYAKSVSVINGTNDGLAANASDLIAQALGDQLTTLGIYYQNISVTTAPNTQFAPISGLELEMGIRGIADSVTNVILEFDMIGVTTTENYDSININADPGCTDATDIIEDAYVGCDLVQYVKNLEANRSETNIALAAYIAAANVELQTYCSNAILEYGSFSGGNFKLTGDCGCIKGVKFFYDNGTTYLFPNKCVSQSFSQNTSTISLTGCC